MKIGKIKSLVLIGLLPLWSCIGVLTSNVFADTNTMTVSPPYRKILLIPGETYSGSIDVFNSSNSTRALKYAVEIGSFSQRRAAGEDAKDDYGAMDHISKTSYNQIMDWIELDKDSGSLEPSMKEDITYTINVPKDAPGGGQYATILVIDETTSGLPGEGNIGIDQKFQFASIIYAEVAGETREVGEVLENSIPSFLLNGPLQTSSMVKNNGNVHTDAQYTLQVWPLFSGEEICTNEENPDTSLILPETERYHAQSCDKTPAIGIFRVKQTVKIFGETSVVERTVILCPLWLMFIMLFIIFVIIMWVFAKIRGRKKHEGSKDSAE